MTARLNSATAQSRRVVSVSAHEVDQLPIESVDDHTVALREVIEEAAAIAAKAQQALSQLQEDRTRADQTSLHLQDQLKTGARLLQATQSQASRIESDLRALDDRQATVSEAIKSMQDRLAQFETSADSLTRRFTSHLADILNSAMIGFEESVSQRCAVLNVIDHRVAEASQRLEAMCATMDTVIQTVNQRLAGATAPLRRELEQRDESAPLDMSGAKNRAGLGGEAMPPLRLQSWAGGG